MNVDIEYVYDSCWIWLVEMYGCKYLMMHWWVFGGNIIWWRGYIIWGCNLLHCWVFAYISMHS